MMPARLHHSRTLRQSLCLLAIVVAFLVSSVSGFAASLTLQLVTRFNGAPLALETLSLTNAAGQALSVTRLDFLLSDIAFRRPDGDWLENTNWQAYASVAAKRTNFHLPGVPVGQFDRLRLRVGLRPELNHSDPAQYPADHPLNPNLNGLHWGWTGGYVFFALEGRWQQPVATALDRRPGAGDLSGYSFHLGNDPMLTSIELPVALNLSQDHAATLVLNLERLFAGNPPLVLSDETSSTHSRTNDPVALGLRSQLATAFAIEATSAHVAGSSNAKSNQALIAKGATPYRFTFARQFPPPALPRDNPLSEEGVALGRRLFHDPILSVNGKQSCASCHQAKAAFTDYNRALSSGAEGQLGTRNAMPLFNLAWKQSFFWDGRAGSLREQVLMPIQNPVEMHENLTNVVAKLTAKDTHYTALFQDAFGSPDITSDRLARALEQFLLSIVSYDSKFDRVMQGFEKPTEEEQRGFQLFFTEYDPRRGFYGADCFHCHGGPFLSNHGFANNGLDTDACDSGLKDVTGRPSDHARFSVPSLRNVALTAPYMHDGRFQTLEEVIEHYSTGVKRSSSLDPNLAKHPAGGIPLTDADKKALVAFLKMMTDEKFSTTSESRSKSVAGRD